MNKQTRFILAHAASLLVTAYKKTITDYRECLPLDLRVSCSAPECYDDLWRDAHKGFLAVSPAFSETAIYGIAGNITFRTFHDYGHLLYRKEFVTAQEVELARLQWDDLKGYLPEGWKDICHCVYFADTVAQSNHEASFGHFPVDQRAFVGQILEAHINDLS